jgi:hypothetical protein
MLGTMLYPALGTISRNKIVWSVFMGPREGQQITNPLRTSFTVVITLQNNSFYEIIKTATRNTWLGAESTTCTRLFLYFRLFMIGNILFWSFDYINERKIKIIESCKTGQNKCWSVKDKSHLVDYHCGWKDYKTLKKHSFLLGCWEF